MSDTIIPIPKTSLHKLLKPVNRLTESCVLRSNNESIYTLCCSQDNSVILYAKTDVPLDNTTKQLNIINIKKLLNGLDCLGDDGEFKMSVSENCIKFSSKNTATNENSVLKYHLVDDNIIKESSIKIENIASLVYDTVFVLSLEKIKQIMSAYTYVSDINKIYFYTNDDSVCADVDDKSLQNIDNVTLVVANEYTGKPLHTPKAVKIEIFKLLATSKIPVKVKINEEFNVFVFETQEDDNTQLKYIISALVK